MAYTSEILFLSTAHSRIRVKLGTSLLSSSSGQNPGRGEADCPQGSLENSSEISGIENSKMRRTLETCTFPKGRFSTGPSSRTRQEGSQTSSDSTGRYWNGGWCVFVCALPQVDVG